MFQNIKRSLKCEVEFYQIVIRKMTLNKTKLFKTQGMTQSLWMELSFLHHFIHNLSHRFTFILMDLQFKIKSHGHTYFKRDNPTPTADNAQCFNGHAKSQQKIYIYGVHARKRM